MAFEQPIAIHWFRQDLRISDNPSLGAACQKGLVLPIYIFDEENPSEYQPGAASQWWLHHSLISLNHSLNGRLNVYRGDPRQTFSELFNRLSISSVFWNRCYEPWQINRDCKLKEVIREQGIEVKSFNGALLWEPWQVLKKDQSAYKVFTPFYRRGCLNQPAPRIPEPKIASNNFLKEEKSLAIDDLELLPNVRWDKKLERHWQPGETAAQLRLKHCIENRLDNYKVGRNYPEKLVVSRLSPHLHFGEISPNQVWEGLAKLPSNDDVDCFRSEIGWREFAHSLLYHFPELPSKCLQSKFDRFAWRENSDDLQAWQNGLTGYPFVDAGMRELWQTGYMHNRVRMVVGSFLVKNLLLHWRHGEKWFWDCLVDADLANNSAGWQWIAGCGADAAPYFRVFNPITQGEKFDPHGEYTKRFVPELANLPDKYLYRPWEAPSSILETAGVTLGKTYPQPMVDVKTSRERALAAYKSIK